MNWTTITFIVYTAIVFVIVLYVGKKYISNVRDFFVGGRRVGWLGTGFSYMASARSASSVVGDSGLAYLMGYPVIFLGIGMTVVEFLNMLYTGPRLRRFAKKYDCITIPDYLESRFEDRAKILRGISILVIVVFFIAYIAAQLVGMSLAFTAIFKWDALLGMAIAAAVVIIYCTLGGYVGVVWTDVMQGILMIVVFVVLPITMIMEAGGVGSIFSKLASIEPKLARPFGQGFSFFLLVTFLAVGSMGNPHLLIRFMSARNSDALRQGAYVSLVGSVIMRWGAIFTGLAGRALWPQMSQLLTENREMVFFTGATNLLPPIITGLMAGAVVAAVMSTVDSQLIVLSSAVARDFFGKFLKSGENMSDKKSLVISRVTVLIAGILAFLFAIFAKAGVFSIVQFAWAGLGAAFGPVVILSVFWKRITKPGAVAGIVMAFVATIVWRLVPALRAIVYEAVPAVILGTLALLIVSLVTSPPSKEKVESDIQLMKPRYIRR